MRFAVALLVPLAACGDLAPFFCSIDDDCRRGNVTGVCTIFNHCAFPDASCSDTGYRYHSSAGDVADRCVGEELIPPPCIERCGDEVTCTPGQDPECPVGDRPDNPAPFPWYAATDIQVANDDVQPSCAPRGGRDLFFQLDITEPQMLYLDDYGSSVAAVLAIYRGACAERTGELACIAPASSWCGRHRAWLGYLDAPGTYCIVADQLDPDDVVVDWTMVVRGLVTTPMAYVQAQLTGECIYERFAGDSCSPAGQLEHSWFGVICDPVTVTASGCASGFSGRVRLDTPLGNAYCGGSCPGAETEISPGYIVVTAEDTDQTCGTATLTFATRP